MTDFGTDLSCISDLTGTLATSSGRLLLAEAIVRRLTCSRGMLFDDPNYGIDVRDFMNDGLDSKTLKRIPSQVDAEVIKDERVLSSSTSQTFIGGILTLSIALQDAAGPFRLNLAVSAVSVQILAVQ